MKKFSLSTFFTYFFLTIGALIMLFPFFWMVMGAFKTSAEFVIFPPNWLPKQFNFDNFKIAFESAPFAKYFVNSIIVTTCSVVTTTLTTILAAFAFSRLEFSGRDRLFTLLLALMMVPFEMLVITNYQTMSQLKMIDTIPALILPFTTSIFYTYILRNFFCTIPDSLYHSAKIDGASNWKYLWRVMVPIAKPSIVTIILLNAIASWNSFFWPMLVTNSTAIRTLPFGLYSFMSEINNEYGPMMAAATFTVIPMVIIFLFARKQIINGVARGGLKG